VLIAGNLEHATHPKSSLIFKQVLPNIENDLQRLEHVLWDACILKIKGFFDFEPLADESIVDIMITTCL
jgi:hypothetical protein